MANKEEKSIDETYDSLKSNKITVVDKETGEKKTISKPSWLGENAWNTIVESARASTKSGHQITDLLNIHNNHVIKDIFSMDGYRYNNWLGISAGNADQLNALIDYTLESGTIPSTSEIANILNLNLGDRAVSNLKHDLDKFLSDNNIDVTSTRDLSTGGSSSSSASTSEDTVSTDIIEELLMTNPYGERANQYRNAMYNSINQYEQDVNASLASTELDAYRLLGQQQLELENQIASQRMQAIKSGVTSAQLASQELANMFAAQSAASSIAQQTMSNRAQQYNTIAQQRASVESDLYNMINSNQTTGANVYAQLQAAQQSYNSYVNQPFAQYQAYIDAYTKNPSAINSMLK